MTAEQRHGPVGARVLARLGRDHGSDEEDGDGNESGQGLVQLRRDGLVASVGRVAPDGLGWVHDHRDRDPERDDADGDGDIEQRRLEPAEVAVAAVEDKAKDPPADEEVEKYLVLPVYPPERPLLGRLALVVDVPDTAALLVLDGRRHLANLVVRDIRVAGVLVGGLGENDVVLLVRDRRLPVVDVGMVVLVGDVQDRIRVDIDILLGRAIVLARPGCGDRGAVGAHRRVVVCTKGLYDSTVTRLVGPALRLPLMTVLDTEPVFCLDVWGKRERGSKGTINAKGYIAAGIPAEGRTYYTAVAL
ncbi:hypothetical protein N8I77_000240 [Diaporthe amygdali]|uniref:Uncharacterized protein n=1 Tax=Phomopsis amygdali TaxID=1214568 RepID=A0AAD9SP61_PHOAM|nr:hypothetical protein N8I77_000240 [Diaporthe amygdali]